LSLFVLFSFLISSHCSSFSHPPYSMSSFSHDSEEERMVSLAEPMKYLLMWLKENTILFRGELNLKMGKVKQKFIRQVPQNCLGNWVKYRSQSFYSFLLFIVMKLVWTKISFPVFVFSCVLSHDSSWDLNLFHFHSSFSWPTTKQTKAERTQIKIQEQMRLGRRHTKLKSEKREQGRKSLFKQASWQ
jgi:hypothetical protein